MYVCIRDFPNAKDSEVNHENFLNSEICAAHLTTVKHAQEYHSNLRQHPPHSK